MKKVNFKWLVVLCMVLGFATIAKAQIYSSEDCFYSKEGSSSVQYVVKFEYAQDRVWLKSVSHSTVRSNLAKSEDFYENEVWTDGKNSVTMYEYDSNRSTSAREVYKRVSKKAIYSEQCWWNNGGESGIGNCKKFGFGGAQGCGRHGYTELGTNYVAFSKDKSSFIKWYEKKDNYDGQIQNRTDYTRVPKEDLLPKAVNDDFLH